jgi:hypothetical protein
MSQSHLDQTNIDTFLGSTDIHGRLIADSVFDKRMVGRVVPTTIGRR